MIQHIYRCEVFFTVLAVLLALGGCEMTIGADTFAWPANVDRGLNYVAWTPGGYGTAESDASLRDLALTGASHVAIVATAYVESLTASVVHRRYDRTPNDESLRNAIELVQSLGLQTVMVSHVDVNNGDYRGWMEPVDPFLWFSSYREVLLHWADIAEETGCVGLRVGVELESMTRYLEQWESLIAEVREHFNGRLSYSANWTDLEEPDTLRLGRMVDILGVDAYFPVADTPDPSMIDMVIGWQPWLLILERISEEMGNPLLINEVGCTSRRGSPTRPWDNRDDPPLDLDVQARYYEATLRALSSTSAVQGVYFWNWGILPGGADSGTHTPRGKPAAQVLQRFWGSI